MFGTYRTGKAPEKSVVGPDLKGHEIRNLIITYARVFPLSGVGDAPLFTIEALNLRADDLLIKNLQKC